MAMMNIDLLVDLVSKNVVSENRVDTLKRKIQMSIDEDEIQNSASTYEKFITVRYES